jgi:predicted O-methyltransferase YrrM
VILTKERVPPSPGGRLPYSFDAMADPSSRAGHTYGTPLVIEHLARVHARHDPPLEQAFRAAELHGIPAIQVGPHEGVLLGWLARSLSARRAVEIGTLGGYSAIHLARALGADGTLHSLEIEPRHAEVARANLHDAGLSARVEVHLGDAVESLRSLEERGPFDLVFVDADKGRYDRYAEWAVAQLRPGGLLVADNVFFFGRLLEDHPDAAAMRRFHEIAAAHLEVALLTTPDGMLLGRKPAP